MCPDRKMQWFKDRPAGEISREKINEIKKLVINRWTKTYAPAQSQIPVAATKKDNKVMRFI